MQPRREVLYGTALEYTDSSQPNQETAAKVSHPSMGTPADAPGPCTFRNLSSYSPYHENPFTRWYTRGFGFVSPNKAAITEVIPVTHEQALVIDASCVPKSGKQTYGLDRF
jgi:hypothetical protein